MLLTQIESYAKKLFANTAELGFKIVATTGNWDQKDHTKLISLNPETRFNSIPALTISFKHMGIKEYHVIMEANMWKGHVDDIKDIKKNEPISVLIIMSCTENGVKVSSFDTMTMKPMDDFGDQMNFESSWSNLMKCPEGAYEMLPKEAIPALEAYWSHFESVQV